MSEEAKAPDSEGELHEMTLLEHLQELRSRLTRSVIALILGLFAAYPFSEELFGFLVAPIKPILPAGSSLIYTAPTEAFVTYLVVALIVSFFVVSPYLFYQLWSFVAPGLYQHEKRWIIPIAIISAAFFISGAAFCYFIVFPVAFEFLFGFQTDLIKPAPKLDEVLSFCLHFLFAFGVIFETPLFIFFLGILGIATPAGLRKFRRFAVLCAFIVAAILTPTPDAFNQILMAAPLIILYEVGILAVVIFGPKKKKPEPTPDSDPDTDALAKSLGGGEAGELPEGEQKPDVHDERDERGEKGEQDEKDEKDEKDERDRKSKAEDDGLL